MTLAGESPPEAEVAPTNWLTRFVFLRMLGLVYTAAFLIVLLQWEPLLGSRGLLPAASFLEGLKGEWDGGIGSFFRLPTLFWLDASDAAFRGAAWIGFGLSMALLLGFANVPSLAALWLLYMSFVHVGQIFYGYGWEILLLETGFLAIFLAPLGRPWPFPRGAPPNRVVILLLRWLIFRIMLGAGLIKLRGDPCWRDLTCLVFHYETQPNPNPFSWYLHQLPVWFHQLEVVFNHLVELVAPFFVFGPRRPRLVAGGLILLFQVLLILSGNLSFLNWITIAVALACLDDGVLRPLVPARLRARLDAHVAGAEETKARGLACYALAVVVALLSVEPRREPAVGPPGHEHLVRPLRPREHLRGLRQHRARALRDRPRGHGRGTRWIPTARWEEYDFKCKPGNPSRRPCWISPYHYRLDWQMWFLAMPGAPIEDWFVHLVAKLLEGDPGARGLLAPGVFEARPPRAIRARYYRYQMTTSGDQAWWKRSLTGETLPALTRDDPRLREYLQSRGWR